MRRYTAGIAGSPQSSEVSRTESRFTADGMYYEFVGSDIAHATVTLVIALLAILMMLSVTGAGVSLLFTRGRPPTWLVKLANRRDPQPTSLVSRRRYVPAPIACTTGVVIAFVLALLVYPACFRSTEPFFIRAVVYSAFYFGGTVLLALAMWLQLKIGSSRRLRYEVLTLAVLCFLFAYETIAAVNRSAVAEYSRLSISQIREVYGAQKAGSLSFAPLSAMLLSLPVAFTLGRRRKNARANRSTGRYFRILYRMRAAVPGFIGTALFVYEFGLSDQARAYLWLVIAFGVPVRFFVVERMREHPVVYLRSFSSISALTRFAGVVVPAVRRYAVLEVIVHPKQTAGDVMPRAQVDDVVAPVRTNDVRWQEQVGERLRVASAVIIDAEVVTDGLRWEVDAAARLVPPERILLLEPSSALKIEGALVVRAAGYADFSGARRAIRHRLKALM